LQLKVHSSYTLQGKTKEDKLNAAVLCALLAGQRLCLMCFSKQLAKFAMLILPVLLLLCYGVGNVHCVHENTTDLHSLLDFKQGITNDPNGALSSWNASIHYCRWMYVVCTQTRPWRVSVLNLTSQSLTGNITSSCKPDIS